MATRAMRKNTPHPWNDKEAEEAAAFPAGAFVGSRNKSSTLLDGIPSGSVDIVDIEIEGLGFALISTEPNFRFTPTVSFLVARKTKAEAAQL